MESSALYGVLTGDVLLLALAMGRLAVAFIVLPIFSNELLPALVRNSVFVSLSLIVLVLHPALSVYGSRWSANDLWCGIRELYPLANSATVAGVEYAFCRID